MSTPTPPKPWQLPWLHPGDGQRWRDRGLVLLIAVAVMIPLLGSFGLWDPWETHYGEVARNLTERNDWISTWWGSLWKNGQGQQEGRYFFSKPILLMWMMAMGMEVFGFSEWGIRLGVALIAILAAVMGYSVGERVWSRRTGFLMAMVLGTSPFFFFLSRQAQTDMPFVGNMTIGLCFFMMAIFGRDREEHASRTGYLLFTLGLALLVIPQLVLIGTGLGWRGEQVGAARAFFYFGPVQVALYALGLTAAAVTMIRGQDRSKRQLYMLGFYVFVALASLAKGLLGFALPGAFIFFYLLLSGEWRRLKEMEIPRGILLFVAVSFPWYVAMLVRHGNAYFQRFFIHDHFKRLATGVHQIDSGSFEHYVKWMGYGLWPWTGFLPAAITRLFAGIGLGDRSDKQKATLFLVIWLTFTFTLFTLSSTKFHHYIFPAVPAACFLIGLLLDDLVSRSASRRLHFILYLSVMGVAAFLAWDLIDDPRHLKNLFTYKYDRLWDDGWNPGFRAWMTGAASVALLGAALIGATRVRLRRAGVALMGVGALVMAIFCLDIYMPTISHTWSQKGVWDEYYKRCTRVDGPPGHDEKKRYCAEQALSYKLNWRGETFYTQNEVIPIREDHEFDYFLEQNKGKPFYAIMDRNRFKNEFQRKLPAQFKGKSCLIEVGSVKFGLVHVPCDPTTQTTIQE